MLDSREYIIFQLYFSPFSFFCFTFSDTVLHCAAIASTWWCNHLPGCPTVQQEINKGEELEPQHCWTIKPTFCFEVRFILHVGAANSCYIKTQVGPQQSGRTGFFFLFVSAPWWSAAERARGMWPTPRNSICALGGPLATKTGSITGSGPLGTKLSALIPSLRGRGLWARRWFLLLSRACPSR